MSHGTPNSISKVPSETNFVIELKYVHIHWKITSIPHHQHACLESDTVINLQTNGKFA